MTTKSTDRYFIRMKGLPWHSTPGNIQTFFGDVELQPGYVHIIKMPDGRDSGEALVGVSSEEEFKKCLKRDKKFMGKRYIELYEATEDEWKRITNRKHRTNKVPISDNSHVILMRGLPFSAQEDDCISFFKGVKCLGVHLTKDRYGRPSGQGYAEFPTEDDFNKGLKFDRQHMQNRYIELFKSSVKELVNAMQNSQAHNHENKNNHTNYRENDYEPKHRNDNYNDRSSRGGQNRNHNHKKFDDYSNKPKKMYCVQLLGLGSTVNEKDLHEFFRSIQCQALRIHRRYDGGEVFVEVANENAAKVALSHDGEFINGKQVRINNYDYNVMLQKILPKVNHGPTAPEVRLITYNKKTAPTIPLSPSNHTTQNNFAQNLASYPSTRLVASPPLTQTTNPMVLPASGHQLGFSPILPATPTNFSNGYPTQFPYLASPTPVLNGAQSFI
eukprot:UN05182